MPTQQLHHMGNQIVSKKLIAVAVALASISAVPSFAEGLDSSMFSVKGFGTVGVVHSDEDRADIIASQFQPNGAGKTREWDASVDSKLGVQLNANFTDEFSAVVQAVSQHQYDNSWQPLIEWANVKYQVTPEFSVRLGRIVLPAFMISDSRMVGYSNPWIRPPEEVYFNSLTTNSDGGDITYRKQFGNVTNTTQVFYGTATAKLPTTTMEAKPDWGINDSIEINALTLRAGYVSYKVDFESHGVDQLRDGEEEFADGIAPYFPEIAAQTRAQLDKYDPDGMNVDVYTLGANYDPGEWFTMGEYVHVKGDSFLSDSDSFYVTAGYRIDQFTPYVTFAQVKADNVKPYHVGTDGAPGIVADTAGLFNSAYDAMFAASQASQRTVSLGVRWDFMPSMDLKVQYDRKNLLDDSTGRLLITPAGSTYQGDDQINVFSAAIDFVF